MGDYRTDGEGNLPDSLSGRQRRKRRRAFLAAVFAFLLGAAAWLLEVNDTVAAAGYITSERHAEVRALAPGIVTAVLVETGDLVAQDDLLVQLDNRGETAAYEEARSRRRKAEAELDLRRAEMDEALLIREEQLRMAALRLEHAVGRLERIRELSARGLTAGAAVADQEHQVRLLEVEIEILRRRDTGIAEREIQVLERELQARRDAETVTAVLLDSREIHAPIAGQVLRYAFVPGEMVRPDAVLLEIFGGDRQVLKLRVIERHAMKVQVGDRYEARLGSYRKERGNPFIGKVERLRNVIQGDDRQFFRAVYCSFDPNDRTVPPGTTAEARIFTGRKPLWRWVTSWD